MNKPISVEENIREDLNQIVYSVDFDLSFDFADTKAAEIARRAKDYLERRKTCGDLKGYELTWDAEGLIISYSMVAKGECKLAVPYSSLA